MKKLITVTLIFLSTSFSFAQIVTGKVAEKPKPVVSDTVKKRIPTDGLDEFSFYFGIGYNYANRSLKMADAPYGKPLGYREHEEGLGILTYQIGVRNRVSSFLSYDAAFMIDRFGEKYNYQHPTSDSTFSYTNKYTYVSLPVQLFFTTGKDFRLFVGGGLQPSVATGFEYSEKGTDSTGVSFSNKVKSIEDMRGFSLSFIASAGFEWRWSNSVSVYFIPTYIVGLTSDYQKQSRYEHFVRGLNLKFGLAVHLKNK